MLDRSVNQERYLEDKLGWPRPAPSIQDTLDRLLEVHEHLGKAVPKGSEVGALFERIRIEIAAASDAKLPNEREATGVNLDLIVSQTPNAYIVAHPDLRASHMFLLTKLFAGLREHLGELREGHIAFIIGHELGHFKLGHYDAVVEQKKPSRADDDPIEIVDGAVEQAINTAFDGLMRLAFTREQEFQCDALALRWMAEAGFNPHEGVEVLEYLSALSAESKQRSSESNPPKERKQTLAVLIGRHLLETHPASDGRVYHGRGVLREIELEAEGVNPRVQHVLVSSSPEISALWDASKLRDTRLQQLVRAVQHGVESAKIVPLQGVLEIVDGKGKFGHLSADELGLAATVAVTELRARHGCLPPIPFGWLQTPPADRNEPPSHGLPDDAAKSLTRFLGAINGEILDRLEGQDFSMRDRFLMTLTGCGRYYTAAGNRLFKECIRELVQEPHDAVSMVAQLDAVCFELETFDREALEALSQDDSPSVVRRVCDLVEICETGSMELRPAILAAMLQEGLFHRCATVSEVATLVEHIERECRQHHWFQSQHLDRAVGEGIARWLTSRPHLMEESVELVHALRCRATRPDDYFDAVILEALAPVLCETYGVEVPEAIEWLEQNVPLDTAGDVALRNILIGRVLEDAVPWAGSIVAASLPKVSGIEKWIDKALIATRPGPMPSIAIRNREPKAEDLWTRLNGHFEGSMSSSLPIEVSQAALSEPVTVRLPDVRYTAYLRGCFWWVSDYVSAQGNFTATINLREASVVGERLVRDTQADGNMAHLYTLSLHEQFGRRAPFKSSDDLAAQVRAGLPQGEFRDYIVLRVIATGLLVYDQTTLPDSQKNMADDLAIDSLGTSSFNDQCQEFLMPRSPGVVDTRRAGSLLALLSPPEIAENRPHFTAIQPSFVLDAPKVEKLYKDELSYQRVLLDASYKATESDRYHRVANRVRAFDIVQVANATGQYIWEQRQESEQTHYDALPPEEKFKAVLALNRYRSEFRDRLLIKIADELEQKGKTFNEFIVKEIYHSLFSSHLQAYLGEKIYNASLESDSTLRGDFERHLTLLLATHPAGSVRRERALKRIADGDRSAGLSSIVRTWDHYDRLTAMLEEEKGNRSHTVGGLLVSGAIGVIEEVLRDPESGISADEKADTLLWLVGVRGKSRLVRCVELVTKRDPAEMIAESSRLSDDERRQLIRGSLAGPGGILKDSDPEVRQRFLDYLFAAIVDRSPGLSDNARQRFKAVYDSMLHYAEPERTAQILSNFLTAHLEGKDEKGLLKVFFSSIPFLGPKAAQYLVSQTTILPPDVVRELMDLTSRVEGAGKLALFSRMEARWGDDARRIVAEIGDWIGGGSGTGFYDVRLHSEGGPDDDTDGDIPPGWSGVVGELKAEVVRSLPEDMQMLHGLVRTIESCPNLFGGVLLDRHFTEQIVYDSAREFDVPRLVRIQQAFKEQCERVSSSWKEKARVFVPAVKEYYLLRTSAGENLIPLSAGPFIFMERAPGESLDLFMERCAEKGTEGKQALGQVATMLSRLSAGAWGAAAEEGGQVIEHCDEHPGNILIAHDNFAVTQISLIDVGITAEIDPAGVQFISSMTRLLVGADNARGEKTPWQRFKQSLAGLGAVSRDEGISWLRQAIDLFESAAQGEWPVAAKDAAARDLWIAVTDPNRTVRQKFSAVQEVFRTVNFELPRSLTTFLRGMAVRDYLFPHVDWAALRHELSTLNGPEREHKPIKIDVNMVVAKVALLARKIDAEIDVRALRAGLQHINRRRDSFSRLEGVYEKLVGHLEERIPERHDRREKIEKLLSLLTSDREFLEMVIEGPQINAIRQLSARAVEERQATAYLGKYWSLAEITDEEARRAADVASFGKMPMLWREHIEPGMLFQVHRSRNAAPELYVSLAVWNEVQVGRVPAHRERSYAFLKESIEDHKTFVKFIDMVDGNQRQYDEVTSLEALIRDGSSRVNYFNKKTQAWESVEKLLMSVGESWSAYERRKNR